MRMRLAKDLLHAARLILGYGVNVYDVKMPSGVMDVELARLRRKLEEIANLDVESARKRWLVQENDRINVNFDIWKKDKKAMLVATSFLLDRQSFMPINSRVVVQRLRNYPYALVSGTGYEQKDTVRWLGGIKAIARKTIQGIDAWSEHLRSPQTDIVQEETVGGFAVINRAGLPADKFKEFVEFVRKGSGILESSLVYGDVYVTTKKILGPRTKTLAYYEPPTDTMHLIADANDSKPMQSFIHEIGHRAWFKKLDHDIQASFRNLYKEGKRSGLDMTTRDVAVFIDDFLRLQGGKSKVARAIRGNEAAREKFREYADKLLLAYDTVAQRMYEFHKQFDRSAKKEDATTVAEAIWVQKYESKYISRILAAIGNPSDKQSLQKELFDLTADLRRGIRDRVDPGQMVSDLAEALHSGETNVFPTSYSAVDLDEFFAENFMTYKLGRSINPRVKALMQKAGL
jgi:hypothetical protein